MQCASGKRNWWTNFSQRRWKNLRNLVNMFIISSSTCTCRTAHTHRSGSVWWCFILENAVAHIFGWSQSNGGEKSTRAHESEKRLKNKCYSINFTIICSLTAPAGSKKKTFHAFFSSIQLKSEEEEHTKTHFSLSASPTMLAVFLIFSLTVLTSTKSTIFVGRKLFYVKWNGREGINVLVNSSLWSSCSWTGRTGAGVCCVNSKAN